ncbi:MAG: 50S ribosomal protein L32 [Anaerolineae bacterium]|nr:50S ribosomal protein L32 [Anaerolineae bacterium]
MPVPKRKTSAARRDRRRSHDAVTPPNLVACPTCHQMRPPHQVCPYCGSYDGREVVTIKEKKEKKSPVPLGL